MAQKILMVEDDFALAMGTEYALQSEGFEVVHATSLAAARTSFDDSIDLVLLDVMLPDGTGYELCKELRSKGVETPILFLTAMSEEVNIVQGLELGGDDYIAKPYRVKELLSRIRANLRRSNKGQPSQEKIYSFGTHIFYPEQFKLMCGQQIVDCTSSELKLLRELIQSRGCVLSRRTLMENIYDVDGEFFDDNTLSVYMKRLRTKLGKDAEYIETVRGVGYRFRRNG